MNFTLGEQIYNYVKEQNKLKNNPSLEQINKRFGKDVSSNVDGMVQSYHDKAVFEKNAGNFKNGDQRLYLEKINVGYAAR